MLLVYRLPREPSRHRVAVWRKLRDLGALYLQDGVAVLPEDAVTREQMEWLQLRVREAGGEATLWEGRLATVAEEAALVEAFRSSREEAYRGIIAEAEAVFSRETIFVADPRRDDERKKLAGWVRRSVPMPLGRKISRHLAVCSDCRAKADTLTKVNEELRASVAPILLGASFAAASVLSPPPFVSPRFSSCFGSSASSFFPSSFAASSFLSLLSLSSPPSTSFRAASGTR